MHVVVFGLCISSSWGNGHATLWRGLVKALANRGHSVTFYEKDQSFYASTRDAWEPPRGVSVRLYTDWAQVRGEAALELRRATLAIVTSYCPDAVPATRLMEASTLPVRAFYDLDTPVTLSALESGRSIPYLPPEGLGGFDLVLSYTGGRALEDLKTKLQAKSVAPLYGWVDPESHAPAAALSHFRADLSYLGTYAADRQDALMQLFVKCALRLPRQRFVIGGAQYPPDFPWAKNIFFVQHLQPSLHRAFFCSSRLTLNVTRGSMASYGYCPSGRLFEAAACGAPILTDVWEGLESFFEPGSEILLARTTDDVVDALTITDRELARIAVAARARVLACHTAARRAEELETIVAGVLSSRVEDTALQAVS